MSVFERTMELGNRILNKKDDSLGTNLKVALLIYEDAERLANNTCQVIHALEEQGLVLRLQYEYGKSLRIFDRAIDLCEKKSLCHAILLRDKAMTLFAMGDLPLTMEVLKKSRDIFDALVDMSETGAITTIMARVLLRDGNKDDALKYFKRADIILNKDEEPNLIYVRNNLRHWVKAEPYNPILRVKLALLTLKIRRNK